MNGASRQETEALASDYVLGMLPPEEADRVERRFVDDDALLKEVRHLRERLQELDFTAAPETISDDLWTRIESGISDKVVALAEHRPADAKRASRGGYWQGFVSAAIAATVLFAVWTNGFLDLRSPSEPLVIAILVDSDANPGAIVEALGENRVRIVPLVDIPVPEGKALEVWTLPDPETGPVSLGLLQTASETSLGGFDLPRPVAEQLYEITLEAEAGSPVGRPTGPVLYKGFAKIPL